MFEAVILTVVPELTHSEFDALLPLVSAEKQARIQRFHFYRDARNCLLGDIMARAALCRATGIGNGRLDFSVNAYGKPLLTNDPRVHHNISHAGDYIACAIAGRPVGIDIELIKPVDLKIAQRFFTPDETEYICRSAERQTYRFFEIWTRKESRIKWEGKGLSKSLSSFSVFDPAQRERYSKVFDNGEAVCYVCTDGKESPDVRLIGTAALLRDAELLLEERDEV